MTSKREAFPQNDETAMILGETRRNTPKGTKKLFSIFTIMKRARYLTHDSRHPEKGYLGR